MLKNFIKAMVLMTALCFTAMLTGVNAYAAESSEIQKGLAELKWGMTLEETEAAMGVPYDKIEEEESAGIKQTLLTYENTDFNGYDSYIILCIEEEVGFEAVNYHIPTDNSEQLYSELSEELKSKCTEYEETDSMLSFCHFDNDNYTVFLFDLGSEVQFSYFPLFPKAFRGEVVTGGGAVQSDAHEPSPETGNAGAAVYMCVLSLTGAVMLVLKKN